MTNYRNTYAQNGRVIYEYCQSMSGVMFITYIGNKLTSFGTHVEHSIMTCNSRQQFMVTQDHIKLVWFFYAVLFSSYEPVRDRRTDGQTDRQTGRLMQLWGRPSNKRRR